jgi:hypothetical protein
MKAFVSIILIVGICLYIVVFHSSEESNYRCTGYLNNSNVQTGVNLRIETYRPWVSLWSDSDAAIWVEIPNQWVDYYGDSEDLGTQLQFFSSSGEIKGNFSKISSNLMASTINGVFEGECS